MHLILGFFSLCILAMITGEVFGIEDLSSAGSWSLVIGVAFVFWTWLLLYVPIWMIRKLRKSSSEEAQGGRFLGVFNAVASAVFFTLCALTLISQVEWLLTEDADPSPFLGVDFPAVVFFFIAFAVAVILAFRLARKRLSSRKSQK